MLNMLSGKGLPDEGVASRDLARNSPEKGAQVAKAQRSTTRALKKSKL
jgi:hypothetical protein